MRDRQCTKNNAKLLFTIGKCSLSDIGSGWTGNVRFWFNILGKTLKKVIE